VSTNLHELSSNDINKKNESFISLYYTSFDPVNRTIWSWPDFSSYQHYFRVKDAYVSHGKLVIRNPTDTTVSIPLTSLWDIRKVFPPSRAGSFSGASEYTNMTSQELTIYQSSCILDTCLMPTSTSTVYNDGIRIVKSDLKDIKDTLKRPSLPSHYLREIPKAATTTSTNTFSLFLAPTFSDLTCGYFLVERLATSISTILDLYCK
jgi:hypothetical protein